MTWISLDRRIKSSRSVCLNMLSCLENIRNSRIRSRSFHPNVLWCFTKYSDFRSQSWRGHGMKIMSSGRFDVYTLLRLRIPWIIFNQRTNQIPDILLTVNVLGNSYGGFTYNFAQISGNSGNDKGQCISRPNVSFMNYIYLNYMEKIYARL